jgi:hypothetical protein
MVDSTVEFTALMDKEHNRILIRPTGSKNAALSEGACLEYVRSTKPGTFTGHNFQNITSGGGVVTDEVKWSFLLNFKPCSQTTFFSNSNIVSTAFNLNFDKAHSKYKVATPFQKTVKDSFVLFLDTVSGISDKCKSKKEAAAVLTIGIDFLTMPTTFKKVPGDGAATGSTELKDAPGPPDHKWSREVQAAHACSYLGCTVFYGNQAFDIFPCCVCSLVQHNDGDGFEFDTSSSSKWSCMKCASV